ncbi:conserved hypothetical protein, steroid delta-isomerase-related [Raineyella antarctica]|uniref:SnoaL-like polyketide cyclase n=1 Tax=Raineyella antarctica TaxID=1577474 RepID=A0A1G6GFU7_9ACTN|nr:ester cyclase [Raineyella antarctica]SDB80871.1 conserved hypothetical protein, steroid delta-isomerase-related [Raineyella antarctica]
MDESTNLTEARMRELAREYLDTWNRHDIDGALEMATDDVVFEWMAGLPGRGKEELRRQLEANFTAFPDMSFQEDAVRVATDVAHQEAMLTWRFTATMTGLLEGPGGRLPPTGNSIEIHGVTVERFRGERICEFRIYYDTLGMFQQLGVLPETSKLGFKAVVVAEVVADKAKGVADKAKKALHRS